MVAGQSAVGGEIDSVAVPLTQTLDSRETKSVDINLDCVEPCFFDHQEEHRSGFTALYELR